MAHGIKVVAVVLQLVHQLQRDVDGDEVEHHMWFHYVSARQFSIELKQKSNFLLFQQQFQMHYTI